MEVQVRSKAKTEILRVAKDLFWKHGIRRVSVQEICKEANISKMTFYRHFENKEALALHVIQTSHNESHKRYRDIMDDTTAFSEKVVALLKLKQEGVSQISSELIDDIFKNQNENLQNYIKESRAQMQKEIMNDFALAQSKGQIRQDLKLEFILYTLNDLNTKLQDDQLRALYNNEEELIMELTRFFFYGIMH